MSIFTNPGYVPVVEKYVGDNHKEFRIIEKEMEKLLEIMYSEFKPLLDRLDAGASTSAFNQKGPNVLNKSKHNKVIEEQFKKFFGLKEFNLVWIQTGKPNAMTPCRSYTFMDKVIGKDGRYYNDKLTVSMMFDVNLVTYMGLNARETIAIILHEIGHNFYTSILQVLARLPIGIYDTMELKKTAAKEGTTALALIGNMLVTYGLFDLINFPKLYVSFKAKTDELLQKYASPVMNIYRLFNEILYNTVGFMRIRIKINPLMIIHTGPYLLSRIASTQVIFGYHTERFSDDFATDHGYGQDLASAMHKMDTNAKNISVMATDSVPGLNWIADAIRVQMDFLQLFLDEHPRSITRVRTGLDRLRKHANDPNIDPKTKKELQKEIKEYEEFYKDYLDLSKNNNNKRIFSWLNKIVVEKIFAGKMDLRELSWKLDPLSKTRN